MEIATILDPANGKGSEVQELEMLTGSGELMQYSFADGTEPQSMEVQSYIGGTKRVIKKAKKKAHKLVGSGKLQGVLGALNAQQQPQMSSMLPAIPSPPTGMSKGLKIGLIVGGIVLLSVVGYVVYKKKKGK